jgi:hypothetical protein
VSALADRDATGRWSAPALTVSVLVDGAQIPGRGSDAGFGGDVAVEEAARAVQAILRQTDTLDVWGVAIDQALTGGEQGEAAGPFIGFTVLAIVLLVGLAFRSYWTLAVVGGALVALLVWLQGLSNLIGLKDDQILATVVPIAMLAFGVDYAFHAVGRYREERADSPDTVARWHVGWQSCSRPWGSRLPPGSSPSSPTPPAASSRSPSSASRRQPRWSPPSSCSGSWSPSRSPPSTNGSLAAHPGGGGPSPSSAASARRPRQ